MYLCNSRSTLTISDIPLQQQMYHYNSRFTQNAKDVPSQQRIYNNRCTPVTTADLTIQSHMHLYISRCMYPCNSRSTPTVIGVPLQQQVYTCNSRSTPSHRCNLTITHLPSQVSLIITSPKDKVLALDLSGDVFFNKLVLLNIETKCKRMHPI